MLRNRARPHKCPRCGSAFAGAGALQAHLLTCSVGKPAKRAPEACHVTTCKRCDGKGTLWVNANPGVRVLCMSCGGTGKVAK